MKRTHTPAGADGFRLLEQPRREGVVVASGWLVYFPDELRRPLTNNGSGPFFALVRPFDSRGGPDDGWLGNSKKKKKKKKS